MAHDDGIGATGDHVGELTYSGSVDFTLAKDSEVLVAQTLELGEESDRLG
jgi:hypothetical protein